MKGWDWHGCHMYRKGGHTGGSLSVRPCGPQSGTVIIDCITLRLQRRYIRKTSGGDPSTTKLSGSMFGQSLLCIHFMS